MCSSGHPPHRVFRHINPATIPQQDTLLAIMHLTEALAMNITTIVVGYLMADLRLDTPIKGITRDMDPSFTGAE